MKEYFDIVVIGSGAGGAPIANRLAKRGKSVLLLEKGPLLGSSGRVAESGSQNNFKDIHTNQNKSGDNAFASHCEKLLRIPGVKNCGESYFTDDVKPDLNDEPHVYCDADGKDYASVEGYTAQLVGGGTQLYGGISLRFTPADFRLRSLNDDRTDIQADPNGDVRREARDWPIGYEQLEPYYALAEELIGVNGTADHQLKPFTGGHKYQPPPPPNPISHFAYEGMVELCKTIGVNLSPYRPPLAVITRDHPPSGRTVPRNGNGVPRDPKSNTQVALLSPIAALENFTIRPNCMATHLSSLGRQVTKVHYLDPGGIARSATAKIIVTACSAIESIRLLKLSARHDPQFGRLIHRNPLLGRYFLTHCYGGARALMPGRFDKSHALESDWATDCCATDEFLRAYGLWAGGTIYNATPDPSLPDGDTLQEMLADHTEIRGAEFLEVLDRESHRGLSIRFTANQIPQFQNIVDLHPTITDKWNRPVAYISKSWHPHDLYLMKIMTEQCGNILRYGGDPVRRDYPIQEQSGIFPPETAKLSEHSSARPANHVLGGARFGTDPADSVLDPYCRAWEFDNLYVTDGSFMPTSGSANPTLTIQANALRVADHLLERL